VVFSFLPTHKITHIKKSSLKMNNHQ